MEKVIKNLMIFIFVLSTLGVFFRFVEQQQVIVNKTVLTSMFLLTFLLPAMLYVVCFVGVSIWLVKNRKKTTVKHFVVILLFFIVLYYLIQQGMAQNFD
jgi:uncharacterized membrane protein YfcA